MSDEHTSLVGSAYNDGYDEGYKDGLAQAVLRVRFYLNELEEKSE